MGKRLKMKQRGNNSAPGKEIDFYYQRTENKVVIGGAELIVVSKKWDVCQDQVDAKILLAVDVLSHDKAILNAGKMIILGSGNGFLPAYLAVLNPSAYINVSEDTFSSVDLVNHTIQANHLTNVQVQQDLTNPMTFKKQASQGRYDVAIILLPKGRKVARRWLIHTWELLADNGILYLAGANDEGIQAVAKDTCDLYGTAVILGYKKGRRIYRSVKTGAYQFIPDWASEPGIKPGSWNTFDHRINDKDFRIHALPGVFSYGHIDQGTQMLIECMHDLGGDHVLDIGCGYGVLGMYAAQRGAKIVHLGDNHLLSVVAAQENLRVNGISNAVAYASDLYSSLPSVSYDLILSNPPFHSGKEVEYLIASTLIIHGFERLNKGGSLVIVANRFIRYQKTMRQVFGNVETVMENTKYHVLTSHKI